MVTSRNIFQRLLHTAVSGMCGRLNSCGGKIDYRSQPSAANAAAKFATKLAKKHSQKHCLTEKLGIPLGSKEFDAYQCWFCRGWHIGGAHNLTPPKFLRIFWFWITGRKRTGEKVRFV